MAICRRNTDRSNMQYVVLFFNKSEKELKTTFEDLTVVNQKAVRRTSSSGTDTR